MHVHIDKKTKVVSGGLALWRVNQGKYAIPASNTEQALTSIVLSSNEASLAMSGKICLCDVTFDDGIQHPKVCHKI